MREAHERSRHRYTEINRHSPRDGFNGFLRGLPGDRAFLSPSSLRSSLLKNLTPASGCQNDTASPSDQVSPVRQRPLVHRIPHPNVRDGRETPLLAGKKRGELVKVICPTAQAEFFTRGDWTTQITLSWFIYCYFSRMRSLVQARCACMPRMTRSTARRRGFVAAKCVLADHG